ncbi:hypothetical protein F5Y06DRAFT_244571 [Hypoxylon sp. FL0890]|nr:hypothetical protein F5Y06DRAFT_244571 [Hypoxylon sp. FL0890]
MSLGRPLRGSCYCGRNQYIVQIPSGASEAAQILFDTTTAHRLSSATPFPAFLRVPLSWYHSEIFPFFPDETRTNIRRIYSHPTEQSAMRQFCGYCGTPLSYWSEQPRSEADYIRLTLGSLLSEDLRDLEDLGLIPDESEQDLMGVTPTSTSNQESQLIGRDITGIPWFESLILGSRLGNIRTTKGVEESRDGRIRVEYEVTEWTADDAEDDGEGKISDTLGGKRKRREAEDVMGGNIAQGTI